MLGLSFRIVPPAVDETRAPAELPEGYVTRLAREKAATGAAREPGAVVLAADTTVVMRGHVFGKPRSEERRVGEEGRSRWSPYHLKKKKKTYMVQLVVSAYLSDDHDWRTIFHPITSILKVVRLAT